MAWPTDLAVTDDLIGAADWNRLEFALAEGSGAGASFDFTSIPQHWTHLLLVVSGQSDSGNANDKLFLRVNNNSSLGQHYSIMHRANGSAASVVEFSAASYTAWRVGSVIGANDGGFSACEILLPNYALADKHTFASKSFAGKGLTATSFVDVCGGFFNPAAAITRLTVFPEAGSFVAGSIATLYGLGAV